jgi:signal transduction histidine kinase/CheY-like chemotaxis protein
LPNSTFVRHRERTAIVPHPPGAAPARATRPGARAAHDGHPDPAGGAEERLRPILDALADAVVVVDAEGILKLANPAAGQLFGRPPEELVGDQFGLPLVAGGTTEVDLQNGGVAEMRTVEIVWEEAPACLASLRDVTERKEAEETARRLWQERTAREEAEKERGRLEELLVRAPAAILTTRGASHVCAFANPEMRRLVAGRPLVGKPLAESLGDLAGGDFLDGFDQTLRQGVGRARLELALSLPAGGEGDGVAERCLDVTWEPLRGRGTADGVLCFAYDVTEQVATRRELETTMARLREEERAKDQFLAVLGHELRNPLAGIDSGLQLVERSSAAEQAGWPLAMIRKQVRALAGLLDDLFDVSVIARGKLDLQRASLSLGDVVGSAVAAVQGRLDERRQTLSVSLPRRPIALDGDPQRLGQVLANLLGNASKYSPPETRIALRARRDGRQAVLEVEDEGAGIPPEMLEEIFEPFIQGGEGSPVAGGLGIGLTLVRQLVELHGGTVTAASAGAGAGSTFTVRLPLAAASDDAEAPAPQTGDDAASCRGCRVLVVDDNEDAARALAELLALRGCQTDLAHDGAGGLAKAQTFAPQVLLLDLDLPDMTGYDVAERLRADGGAGLTIIAISGFGHEPARRRSRESGIDHHFVKPVDLDRLLPLLAPH